ncbi:hypothetical protein Angca_002092, partial [Angiostrongylus cantonensis]
KSLQNNKELLDIYNGIFEKQLRPNSLEEFIKEKTPQAFHLLNISHREVFTPNKNAAEVRIVHDTSAHYNNCLSLSDVLHCKPFILPKIINFSVSLESV